MSGGWLATSWVVMVAIGAWRHRPVASAVRRLSAPSRGAAPAWATRSIEALGRVARRRLGRPPAADLDRRLGWSLVAGGVGGLIEPALVLAGPALWASARWRALRADRRRAERVHDDTPDVVDLFVLAVDSGCNPRLAVDAVASWTAGPWGEALGEVSERVAHGQRLARALGRVSLRLGDPARPLVVALLDTEHYGVPLAPSLERLSREVAVERRRRAEERARRVPVQLLFPLVFCTLPAFVLLTVVPLLAGTLPALSP